MRASSWTARAILTVPRRTYHRLTLGVIALLLALVATGGWVRLSGSGLGCPTWPKCYGNDLVAHNSYHSLVEFVNRCVIAGVGVVIAAAFLGAILMRPRRRDLTWLSAGLIAGYVGEAVLGGITVLMKLAPGLVAAHYVLAMLLITDAVALHWRAGDHQPWATGRPLRDIRLLGRLTLAAVASVVVLGTVATGSGPHSGSPGTERFPIRFTAAAELHAVVGMFLFGLIVATFFALRAADAPRFVQRAYLAVVSAVALQGVIGYVQYFSGLQVDLVETHLLGAALVVVFVVRFNLCLGAPATPPVPTAPTKATPSGMRDTRVGVPTR